ncbi:cell division protein ZapB [Geotalea uraniireducens]|uniref:Cell division protein ZapB n=1 Tax=Geotalea uraniireducens TaxID=351604 RepID=A0ABM8EJD5_9BACT|nr:cell division protein ZapB [Geotalea uraniireducens]BDV42354.1 cell division protein ZapB [Geotalea uraniireducens]
MDGELFAEIERRVDLLLERYLALKGENEQLRNENSRLMEERNLIKGRLDIILDKLERV